MDMTPPTRTALRSYGLAMFPSISKTAPTVLGVLLVFGCFLSNLVVAAGIPSVPITTTAVTEGGKFNQSENRLTYDELTRRSRVGEDRHPVNTAQVTGAVINRGHRADTSQPDCRLGDCGPPPPTASSDKVAVAVAQPRSLPISDDLPLGPALGTRKRPITSAPRPVPVVVARRKKDKKDDDDDDEDDDDERDGKQGGPAKTFKIKKHKLKKWLLPLLVGYKLKFMTLVPLLFATLALLVASAGFAGFFFAMFTAALTLPKGGGHH